MSDLDPYARIAERALRDEAPSAAEARWILDGDDVELLPLLHAAYVPRRRHFGNKVMVHFLNNVQNGLCPEDCGYCSQNRDSRATIQKYAMKGEAEILAEAEHAARGRQPLLHGALGPRPDPRSHAPPRRDRAQGEGALADRGLPLRRAAR